MKEAIRTLYAAPIVSAWDVPDQREVNAVLAADIAAKGEAGEFTTADAFAVFTNVEDEELDRRPRFLTEYEFLTGRHDWARYTSD